jgi:phosphoserine phosphatase RsbU/P
MTAEPLPITSLNILIVDDDDLFLEVLALEMEALGCSVQIAADGAAALVHVQLAPVDVLITDWQMPGMDGLELVRQVRAAAVQNRFLHIVMMTARADSSTIRAATLAGVDDFLFKPLDPLQLELTVASARRNVRLHRSLERRNRHLVQAHDRIRAAYRHVRADLDAAAALHHKMLPNEKEMNGVGIAWAHQPAMNMSGDTLGVTRQDDKILFFLADVQGHGVPAALASFHLHHRLVQLAPGTPAALASAIEQLNHEIEAQPNENYATLICGLLSPKERRAWIIRAGHPDPLIVAAGRVFSPQLSGSFPLGWFADAAFMPEEVNLEPGARLVLFSDGVTECADLDGSQLEIDGLGELLLKGADEPLELMVERVKAAVAMRRGTRGFDDDISLLAIEMDSEARVKK